MLKKILLVDLADFHMGRLWILRIALLCLFITTPECRVLINGRGGFYRLAKSRENTAIGSNNAQLDRRLPVVSIIDPAGYWREMANTLFKTNFSAGETGFRVAVMR